MTSFLSRRQALAGAIASSEIELLPLHEQDRRIAEMWADGLLTGDEAVAQVLAAAGVGTAPPKESSGE